MSLPDAKVETRRHIFIILRRQRTHRSTHKRRQNVGSISRSRRRIRWF